MPKNPYGKNESTKKNTSYETDDMFSRMSKLASNNFNISGTTYQTTKKNTTTSNSGSKTASASGSYVGKNTAISPADRQTQIKNRLNEINREYNSLTIDMVGYENGSKLIDSGYDFNVSRLQDLTKERDALQNELDTLKMTDKYSTKMYDDNFFGQFGASYAQGSIQEEMNLAWNEYLKNPSEANRQKAEGLSSLMEQFQQNNTETLADDATLPWLSQSLANYLPQFINQAKYSAGGALAGGTAGAVAGSAIPGLGTLAGAGYGIKAGIIAGSGKYSYDTMRGAAFQGLIENGVPEEIAREAANDEAVLSAIIEMADTGVDIATLGVGSLIKTLTKNSAKTAAKAVAKAGAEASAESALKRFAKALGKYGLNIASEAAQEGSQEIISIENERRTANGDLSGISGLASAAVNRAFNLTGEEKNRVGQAMSEGAKIAAMMGGATAISTNATNAFIQNKTGAVYNVDINALIEEGLQSDPSTESYQMAVKLKKRVDSGKTVSNIQASKLAEANQRAIDAENVKADYESKYNPATTTETTVQTATQPVTSRVQTIQTRLVESGMDSAEAETAASSLSRILSGDITVTNKDKDVLSVGKTAARQVFEEETGIKLPASNSSTRRTVSEYITQSALSQQEVQTQPQQTHDQTSAQTEEITQPSTETAQSGESVLRKAAYENAVEAQKRRSAQVIQADMVSLGENGKRVYQKNVTGAKNISGFSNAFQRYYDAGTIGLKFEDIRTAYDGEAERSVLYEAYAAGVNDAKSQKSATEKKPVRKSSWKKSSGRFYDNRTSRDSSVDEKSMTALKQMAKTFGVDIEVVDTIADDSGRSIANGYYSNGKIVIAADSDNPLLTVAKHEVTHHIQRVSPEMYQAYKDYVMSAFYNNSQNAMNDEIQRQINLANEADIKMTRQEAMDEIVANATEKFLTDRDSIDQLARQNRSLGEAILNAIRDVLKKIQSALQGAKMRGYSDFMNAEQLKKAEQMWVEALADASTKTVEFRTGDGQTVVEDTKGNPIAVVQENGSAVFSLKTYEEGGRDYLETWLDKRVKGKKLSRADADSLIGQMDEYYDICKQFTDKYAPFGAWSKAEVVRDSKGKPVFSVVKANGEYAMNLDFSLVCKKRRTLDAVFSEMINRGILDDADLSEAEISNINSIIRENGFETACALCFVDSKRYRQAKVADSFVDQYNELVKMLLPEDGSVSAHYFDFIGTGNYKNEGAGLHTMPDADLKDGIAKLRQVMKDNGEKTVPYKIAKHLLASKSDRKLLTRSEFMNTKGFEAVKTKNPSVMKLYNSSKGSGGPKAAFSDVQYLGDILKKNAWTPAKAYAVGGVRIQSFSDYIPRLVFDYIQMIGDLSAKQLPAHAYTKEAMFAKQFGMTGIKINLSLVPAIAEDGVAPGLDANGDYYWYDGQSFGSDVNVKGSGNIGFELAKQIQNAPGYSANCGTIAVGVSDEHIRKMLDDPDIRMVIPYHKSSLNHIVSVMNNIDAYKDYTDVQNTRDKKTGSKITGKEFNYNEALRRTGDAKTAAAEYLAWCEENGYLPKFDQFADNENYYKLLEDFATYDNGKAVPQGPVTMTFPKDGDAFGSMADLINEGLEEDALLEARRQKSIPDIVDQIEAVLKKKDGDVKTQFSLKDVPPVHPTNGKWERGATFDEVKAEHPTLFELDADDAEVRNPTQITGTVKSYRKIYDSLKAEGFDGTILDASSGLGYGTKAGIEEYGFDVEDIEPFPDASYHPKYTDYSTLDKQYDVIISNAVLNVIPQDLRDNMVVKIGEMLKPGGRAFINVRGKDVLNASSKVAINEDQMEYFISSTGSYQKGFTKKELVGYLQDALGEGFTVEPTSKYGAVAAIVTKDSDQDIRFSLKDSTGRSLTKEQAEFFKDSKVRDENGRLIPIDGFYLNLDNKPNNLEFTKRQKYAFDLGKHFSEKYGTEQTDYEWNLFFENEPDIAEKAAFFNSEEQRFFNAGVRGDDPEYKLAIRFGDIPNSGKSKNWATGELERGVSVVDFLNEKTQNGNTVYDVIYGIQGTDKIIVGGWDFGIFGSDGEPLLIAPEFICKSGEINRIKRVTNTNPTSDPDIRFQLKENEKLLRENEKLRETVNGLKEQFKTTKVVKTDKRSLDSFAKSLLKDYSSDADTAEVRSALDDLFTYMANGENGDPPVWNDVFRKAYDVAVYVLQNATEVNDDLAVEYSDLRHVLRTRGISINKDYDHDLIGYESINDFRKANMGRIKITNDGLPVDVAYQELAESYPGFFDEKEHTTQPDQLNHIEEVLDRLAPVEYNPYERTMRETATWLANEIIDNFFDLPQQKPTYADVMEGKVAKAKYEGKKKLDAERQKNRETVKKLISEHKEAQKQAVAAEREKQKAIQERKLSDLKAKHKEQMKAVRDERDAKLKAQHQKDMESKEKQLAKLRQSMEDRLDKEKQKQKEKDQKRKDKAERDKVVTKIQTDVEWLSERLLNPTDSKHIPEDFKRKVASFLENIDFTTTKSEKQYDKTGKVSQKQIRMAELLNAYKEIANDESSELILSPIEDEMYNALLELSDKGKRFDELEYDELVLIHDIIRYIKKGVASANRAFNKEIKETITGLGENVISENVSKKKNNAPTSGVASASYRLLHYDMVQPQDKFHEIGGTMEMLYKEIRKGFDKHILNIKSACEYMQNLVKGHEDDIKDWSGKTAKAATFTLEDGSTIDLTVGQVMSLYELMKRPQAVGHILEDGQGIIPSNVLVEANKKLFWKIKVKGTKRIDATQASHVTINDIMNICSSLTEDQMKIADGIQRFFNTVCSDWGNETSMTLYDYKKFVEENYFPIKSSDIYLNTRFDDSGDVLLKNMSFTKSLTKKANNPIVVEDIFDVMTNHVNQMSMYNALVVPLTDFSRVFNYRNKESNQSVKGSIIHSDGTLGYQYIVDFIKDINREARPLKEEEVVNKLISKYKKSAVAGSIRVLVQQPTSIVRATEMISPEYIVKGLFQKANYDEMFKWSPIAYWKSLGFFETNMGRSMKGILLGDDGNMVDKLTLDIYGKADDFAWAHLWNAVKLETMDKHPGIDPASDRFMKIVSGRFEEIVDRTQVVDTVFHRSQIMRSTTAFNKMVTAFMAERTKSYNLLRSDIWVDAVKNKDKSKVARALVVYVATETVNAMVAGLYDAFNDPEDEDKDGEKRSYLDKYLDNTWENIKTNINPLNMIVYLKEIQSIFDGFTVERMDIAAVSDVISTAKKFVQGKYRFGYLVKELAEDFSGLTGIPIKNVNRQITLIVRSAGNLIGGTYYAEYWVDKLKYNIQDSKNRSVFYKHYTDALLAGYDAQADMMLADMVSNGIPYENIIAKGYAAEKKVAFKDASNLLNEGKESEAKDVIKALAKKYDKKYTTLWKAVKEGASATVPEETYDFNDYKKALKNGQDTEMIEEYLTEYGNYSKKDLEEAAKMLTDKYK